LCFLLKSNAQHSLHFDVMKATPCDRLTQRAISQTAVSATETDPVVYRSDNSQDFGSQGIVAQPKTRCQPGIHHSAGFAVASQRLAGRRLTLLCEENAPQTSPAFAMMAHFFPGDSFISAALPSHSSRLVPLHPRKTEQYRTLAGADQERSQLTLQDRFEAHDLDAMLLHQLRQQLQRYPIRRASLVKKRLRFFPEQPLYVLLVEPSYCQVDFTLGTQIAQELKFGRDLLVRLSLDCEPSLIEQIWAKADGNLVD
jgi:hypothetical protein